MLLSQTDASSVTSTWGLYGCGPATANERSHMSSSILHSDCKLLEDFINRHM